MSDLPPPTGPAVSPYDVPTQPVPVLPTPPPTDAPEAGRGRHRGRFWLVVGAAALALVVGAVLGARAGGGSSNTSGTRRPATTLPIPVTDDSVVPVTDRPPITTDPAPAPTTDPVPVTYGEGIMPDVVCMNLQAAQDEIQKHGVFYSRSKDATGKGRRQILDRNWIVVAQDPAPGTPIGEGDAVLSVVKTNETNPC